jgi:K+-sensing histidine kinase KdpD
MELFNNAIVHGGPTLSIVSARTHACGGMAIMEIADNGQGVPEAHQERIFLPFEKVNQKICDESVGVGLALVHKFLQLRSSAITCGTDAELGGACFKIALPQKYYAN